MGNYLGWIIFMVFFGPLVGSVVGVVKKPAPKSLCLYLSFAAGVMYGVSFLQLIPEAIELSSILIVCLAFFSGFALMWIVDSLLPHIHPGLGEKEKDSFQRSALTILVGITLHNLPEGFAISSSFASVKQLGLLVAIAISVHDVPETILCVAPTFALTGRKWYSFSLGMVATVPTLIGLGFGLIFFETSSSNSLAITIAATAGIMVYLSGDELLPASQKFGFPHISNFGLLAGILFVLLMGLFL